MKLVQWKIMDIGTSFIWIIIFFDEAFEYSDSGIFRLLKWMQKLHQSTWDDEILNADMASKDELLISPLFWGAKNMNMEGSLKLKFAFYFMETTCEPLHLDKWSYVQWKIMDITSFMWIIFYGAFECGGGSKFWGHVGPNI
jgi:hypothetical protein